MQTNRAKLIEFSGERETETEASRSCFMSPESNEPGTREIALRSWVSVGTAWALVGACLAGVIFWFKGIGYLHERHPHEDAFILFRYAEHFGRGEGIAFNRGGPPTEGATDFLYLVLLSGFVHFGADVAVAAVWLNALGSGLIAFLLVRISIGTQATSIAGVIGCIVASAVPFLAGAHASYDGFGTQLYCALILLNYSLCFRPEPASLVWIPYSALMVALFRPDGVIVGAGFCLVAVFTQLRAPATRNSKWLRHAALASAVGAAYFVWRYQYFGEALPLPLYVKSRGSERFPGFDSNMEWLGSANGPLPLLLATGVFIIARKMRRKPVLASDVLSTLPVWMLLAAMAFAHQSQNVDWRFQAPVYTTLMAAMLATASELGGSARQRWLRPLTLLISAAALLPAIHKGKKVWPLDYMDNFAVRLGPLLANHKVALTEAGRIAYWSDATVYDMVGLNLRHTAKRPPNIEYVNAVDPDVVMFHVAGTIDFSRLPIKRRTPKDAPVVRLDARRLPAIIHEPFRSYLNDVPQSYGPTDLPTKIAPVVLSAYLAGRQDFDVFAVRYNDSYSHIFGVKREGSGASAIKDVVLAAHNIPYQSYAAAKQLPANWAPSIRLVSAQGAIVRWLGR